MGQLYQRMQSCLQILCAHLSITICCNANVFAFIMLTLFPCGDSTYIPTSSDVGMHIALIWTPVRCDGKIGKPLIACSNSPVVPGTNIFCSCNSTEFLLLLICLTNFVATLHLPFIVIVLKVFLHPFTATFSSGIRYFDFCVSFFSIA